MSQPIGKPIVTELNERSREIFRMIVDAYVKTGEPVGSRTLARRSALELSPATIRNIMADLEEAGLLFAPHTSAGRLPTSAGLRFFVDSLLERRELTRDEQAAIARRKATRRRFWNRRRVRCRVCHPARDLFWHLPFLPRLSIWNSCRLALG